MIRDFCNIKKRDLKKEINRLKELVDGGNAPRGVNRDTMIAIDHVREMGTSRPTWKGTST